MRIQAILTGIFIFIAAHTQQTNQGVIEGRVYNAMNNDPVEFATVAIEGTDKGTVTDLDGSFVLTGIEPGYWQLTVSYIGYEKYIT